ncbi:MAG: hypothetical protein RRC34_10630 [Lentisphaeria bacterium]|nr:hypothetical protein [Lentisphaeria bacterium]
MKTQSISPSLVDANREFADLVKTVRLRALWFIAPHARIDIGAPEADRILQAITQSGDRSAWLRARKLMSWRSQHCK